MLRTAGSLLLLALAGSAFAIEPPRERERWAAVTVGELTILGNTSERELRDVANRTIRLRDAMARMTSLRVRSPLPTKIYVFSDERSFVPYRDAVMGRVTEHTRGVFLAGNEGNYVVMFTGMRDDATRTIQHELTHHFLSNTISTGVPLWFSEGLCEVYSTFAIEGNSVKIGLPDENQLALLREGPLIPLSQLFAIDEHSAEYSEGSRRSIFYAESWALVHDLVIGNGERRAQVGSYLRLIAAGEPANEAFRQAFATTDEQMERELRSYIRSYSSLTHIRLNAADLAGPAEAPVPAALSRDEVLAALGDLLVHCTPALRPDAVRFLGEALRLNPKNAAATASLAVAKVLDRKHDEADALYLRAVELGVKEWTPYAVAADRLVDRGVPSPADVAKARTLYERAAVLNPDAARAWAGIGATYVGASGDVKPGIAALEKGMKLDGKDAAVAANLALLYLHDGRRAEAQRLVDGPPLANDVELSGRILDALAAGIDRQGADLIPQGKKTEGTETLTGLAPPAHDPAPRPGIGQDGSPQPPASEEQRQMRELNRARSFAVNRHWKEALEIVDRLLPTVRDPKLAAQAKELRKQIVEMGGQ